MHFSNNNILLFFFETFILEYQYFNYLNDI